MQLRHYFFIGTLNPTLSRLAQNNPHLGKTQSPKPKKDDFYRSMSLASPLMATAVDSFVPSPSVSQYTNAFAITQLCAVLCAPWNGLIMDRHKGKKLDPGKPLRQLQVAPVFSAVAADPLTLCRRDGAGGRPALLLPLPPPHLPAGPALLSLRLTSFPPAAVPHLRPTSPQPLLPLRRERGVH